jgi:hypothetical protein
MRWARHVARTEAIKNVYTKFLSENLKGRDHVENLVIHGKIILERILGK